MYLIKIWSNRSQTIANSQFSNSASSRPSPRQPTDRQFDLAGSLICSSQFAVWGYYTFQDVIMIQGQVKDYYSILGISHQATSAQIQNAYEKLVKLWHPQRQLQNRSQAELRFADINEAFEVLYDRNSRSMYDQLFKREYSLGDAQANFNRFYTQHELIHEDERKFFEAVQLDRSTAPKNHYAVLGLTSQATLEQLEQVYRVLAIKYHPRNNLGRPEAISRFIEVNEAYQAVSRQKGKECQKMFAKPLDEVKPHPMMQSQLGVNGLGWKVGAGLHPTSNPTLNTWMEADQSLLNLSNGHTSKHSTVYARDNGRETRRTVKSKIQVEQGKTKQVRLQEQAYPTGDRQLVYWAIADGNTTKTVYYLNKDQTIPQQSQF